MAAVDVDPRVLVAGLIGVVYIYVTSLKKTGKGAKYVADRGRGAYSDVKSVATTVASTAYKDTKSIVSYTVGKRGVLGWLKRRI